MTDLEMFSNLATYLNIFYQEGKVISINGGQVPSVLLYDKAEFYRLFPDADESGAVITSEWDGYTIRSIIVDGVEFRTLDKEVEANGSV